MKKSKNKHLLRTIRKSGVSFFAVAFIAAVSIAIFLGLQSSADAILREADRYFNENKLEHWEASCANGITQEDVDAMAQWEEVSIAEGGYTDTALLDLKDERVSLRTLSLCEQINIPVVLEGQLPQGTREVAVEQTMAEDLGISVGDTITLENDGSLLEDTFQVTAVINQPNYDCDDILDARGKGDSGLGSNEYYVALDKAAFDTEYFSDCYTTVYVYSDALDGMDFYSSAYEKEEAPLRQSLETKAEERAQLRYDSLMADAQEEIADAEAELADAEAEIAEGEAELSDNQAQLEDSLKQLQTQLAALGLSTDLDQAEEQLAALGAAGQPLVEAIAQWRDGQTQLAEGQEDLEEARMELADGEADLAEAKEQLEDLQLEDWIVSGRNEAGDVRGVKTTVDSIYGLSYSLSIVFLIVAVLVCYAAITRMIDEQRVIIGTQKAVGFTPREILNHYMLYNFLCALLGILIGWLASVVIVEILILYIFTPRFLMGAAIPLGFSWGPALISAVICLGIYLTATYAACSKLIKVPATMLLRGEIPEKKKNFFFEHWAPYRKLSLYSRTMIKNVLNDQGRMMTTITGLMGCVSLLIMCFSMKLGIEDSSVRQFDRYFLYDNRLVFNSQEGSAEDYTPILEENGVEYALVQDKLMNFRAEGEDWDNAHVMAVDSLAGLDGFVDLVDVSTGKAPAEPEDGLLVSRKCAEMLGLKAGSTVELMDNSGNIRECQISGVIEHYLGYHLFVTTTSYWEEVMGEGADLSVMLLKGDVTGLKDQVKEQPGFLFLRDNSDYDADSRSINMVIYVCLALSVVLVLLVLLNQIVMYINRKSRELAVMRVNGYTMNETKAYIYKDNIVLTILGLLFGTGVGIGLSYVVIRIIETGALRYVRDPNWLACLLGCAIVAVMAVIVNLIALRKIKQLNLTNVSSN